MRMLAARLMQLLTMTFAPVSGVDAQPAIARRFDCLFRPGETVTCLSVEKAKPPLERSLRVQWPIPKVDSAWGRSLMVLQLTAHKAGLR